MDQQQNFDSAFQQTDGTGMVVYGVLVVVIMVVIYEMYKDYTEDLSNNYTVDSFSLFGDGPNAIFGKPTDVTNKGGFSEDSVFQGSSFKCSIL